MAQFLVEDIHTQLVSLVGDSGADRLMEALDAKMETHGYLDERRRKRGSRKGQRTVYAKAKFSQPGKVYSIVLPIYPSKEPYHPISSTGAFYPLDPDNLPSEYEEDDRTVYYSVNKVTTSPQRGSFPEAEREVVIHKDEYFADKVDRKEVIGYVGRPMDKRDGGERDRVWMAHSDHLLIAKNKTFSEAVSAVLDDFNDDVQESIEADGEASGLDEALAIAQGRSPFYDYEVPKPGKVGPKAKRKRKYGKSWHRGYVDLAQRGNRPGSEVLEPVEAYLKGVWAVHKRGSGWWGVTHAPSGMASWTFDSKGQAQKALDAILDEFPFLMMIGKDVEPGRGHDVGSQIYRHMDRIKQIISDVKATN